jgi:plastocyanin
MFKSSLVKTFAFSLILTASGFASTITGKVTMPPPAAPAGAGGGGYSRGVYRPQVQHAEDDQEHGGEKAEMDCVVWAEPVGGKAPFRKPAKNPEMIQQNKMFVPYILPVQTGTQVEFPNLDPLYHNVFSYSRAKRFDLGRYDEGNSKSVLFDQAGVVDVFCEIHDNMHAYVLVLDSPWFTRVASDGTYSLEVPAGNYRVYAWIPSRQSEPVEINLDSDSSGRADFAF